MSNQKKKWIYLVVLSLIWGSSFILIKRSLVGLTAFQVGGLRILMTTLFLLPVGLKSCAVIKKSEWKWIAITGFLSSFFPPILFALAQTEIDSAVTSIFNSLTPLNTTLVGVLLFGLVIKKKQIIGVIIGLLGTFVLIYAGAEFNPDQNYYYAFFVLASSLGYAFNINIIKKRLGHISALAITTGNFIVIVVPAIVLVYYTGFFETVWESPEMHVALIYLSVLSLFGTAVSKVLFNELIHISSPVFSASVTYVIPLVAVLWGVLDGEQLNLYQLIGGLIILIGVYLVNKKNSSKSLKK